jgi:UDP-GlcNAc:undecaprenyl-phosphate/decaprenyl-phosphate GlcNAc-1-phosphate transferase
MTIGPINPIYFLVLPFIFSAAMTLVVERTCIKIGLFDWPGARKMQKIPVPRLGGLAIALTPLVIGLFFKLSDPWMQFWGAFTVFAGGLIDDVSSSNTVVGKLCFQVPAAILFTLGCNLDALHLAGISLFAFRLTIFGFVFFMTNASNLMDNMNGLSAGISLVIIWSISGLSFTVLKNPEFAIVGLLVGASILGFCMRNFPLGKIYMGDSGSQFLGFFSATYIILFWLKMPSVDVFFLPRCFLLTALLFLPYLYDVFSVVRIRLREGRSPFIGDQCHISHRLVKRGFSPTKAVLIIVFVELAISVLFYAIVAKS